MRMAERCLRLALATDSDHAESLCNLGVLKMQEGRLDEARHLFQSATLKGAHLYEAHFNHALLLHEVIKHFLNTHKLRAIKFTIWEIIT